jgi:pimeloyl-ACP methyl ester carboxylesterase
VQAVQALAHGLVEQAVVLDRGLPSSYRRAARWFASGQYRRQLADDRCGAPPIGILGHSDGGKAAGVAIRRHPQIRAGANLDGMIAAELITAGLDRPFGVMLGVDANPEELRDIETFLSDEEARWLVGDNQAAFFVGRRDEAERVRRRCCRPGRARALRRASGKKRRNSNRAGGIRRRRVELLERPVTGVAARP